MRGRWIPVRRILVLGPDLRIDLDARLIRERELAIEDFHARAERRAARRVADREEQLTAGMKTCSSGSLARPLLVPLADEHHDSPICVACELGPPRVNLGVSYRIDRLREAAA